MLERLVSFILERGEWLVLHWVLLTFIFAYRYRKRDRPLYVHAGLAAAVLLGITLVAAVVG